jgi:hypothetical protein
MATNTTARRRSKPNSRRNPTSSRQQPRRRKSVDRASVRTKQPTIPTSPLTYLVRVVIGALGASTIVGTAISVVHPPKLVGIPIYTLNSQLSTKLCTYSSLPPVWGNGWEAIETSSSSPY